MTTQPTQTDTNKTAPTFVYFAPVAVFLVIALTLIAIDHNKGRAYFDHTHFHLPVILGLIENFDISDYKAATAPGYHLIFASIGNITDPNIILFKLVNSLITSLLIGYLCLKLKNYYRPAQSFLIMLPFVLSVYILPSGIWLLPDNLAWLLVAWVIFTIQDSPYNNKQLVGMAIVLAIAVFVRQTYLWLMAIVWASALFIFMVPNNINKPYANTTKKLENTPMLYAIKCLITTLPAVVVLALLAITWQGLVPPSFQSIHHHISPSAPAFFFALFAVYTTFYIPLFAQQIKEKVTIDSILIGGVIGFLSVIFVATSYDIKAGRFGGLWNIVKITPTIADKSVLMIILSTIGGCVFAALMQLLSQQKRVILIVASIAFISAMTVNQFVYERYFSGFVYILLILLISNQAVNANKQSKLSYLPYYGVIAFAILNTLILYRNLNQNL